jgi:putative ABC transport system permease protein
MPAIRRFFARIANLFSRKRADREFSAEIAAHLALMQEEYERRGMTPEQARRESLVTMGGVEQAREMHREARAFSLLDQLGQDVRYALRQLFHSPGFATTAVLVLALGIGINTAIFTVFDEVAFRPLPVKDGDRIVGIFESFHGQYTRQVFGSIHFLSFPEFQQYATQNRVFSGTAAYADARGLTMEGSHPEPVSGMLVTQDYFSVLGASPALGRVFLPEETSSPHAVAVLSNSFWRQHFGGDAGVVGKTIQLNKNVYTVVGVTGPGFSGAEVKPPDVWLPISMQPLIMTDLSLGLPQDFLLADNMGWLSAVGKLNPGVSSRKAEADLQLMAARMDAAHSGRVTQVSVIPSTFLSNPEARTAVLIGGSLVMVAVGLVLIVACANIANLLLARAAARQKEIAVRLAIGATRGRLIRQLLTESSLLALVGGGLGLLLAWKSLDVARAFLQLTGIDISPDARVLGFTGLLCVAASLMFGLIPAIQSTNPDLSGAMKEEGSILGRRVRAGGTRNRLIAGQVAICSIFLIVAALLVRGLTTLSTMDPGFHVNKVFVTTLDLRLQNYDDAHSTLFFRNLMERIDAVPGARSALASCTPWQGVCGDSVTPEGRSASDPPLMANFNSVSSNYFDVLGIRVIQGRAFTDEEVQRGDAVALVSAAMQQAYWHGQSAIGKRFTYHLPGKSRMVEIVGIAADVRSAHISSVDGPFFYIPLPSSVSPSVVTRFSEGEPAPGTIQRIAQHLDPNVLASVTTMNDKLARQNGPVRIGALLALALGGLVLALASVGIYGVMAYVVSQRTREIAIRMTLGAENARVIRWMLRETTRPVLIGMAIGIPLAAGAAIASSKLLLGVKPLDPIAFLAGSIFPVCVALIASYLPARSAMRVDPMVALRHE